LTDNHIRKRVENCQPKSGKDIIPQAKILLRESKTKDWPVFFLLLSAKTKNEQEILFSMPINRHCGYFFQKVSPLSRKVSVRQVADMPPQGF